MEKTTRTIQINIRISEPLIDEIEEVSSLLKINRAEWIRSALAREAFEERNRLIVEMREVEKHMDKQMKKEMERMKQIMQQLRR